MSSIIIFLFLLFIIAGPIPSIAKNPHVIHFRSLNLYPEGLAYDPSTQNFIVSSLYHSTLHSVSEAGVIETLISDPSLPPNITFLGLAVDKLNNRLLAAINSASSLSPFNALAAYDLSSRQRVFLSLLPSTPSDDNRRPVANAVTVDFKGNAYVTNSLGYPEGNFIWKVNPEGEASIFSRAPLFTQFPVDRDAPYSYSGLNGIAYVSNRYLLVVQSNTGKLFKVDAHDGTASNVLLGEDLPFADGIAIRGDGVLLVVSHKKLWFLKSDDSWEHGVVYDKTDLDVEKFATSVVVGREDRVYVIYGSVMEGKRGREWFAIAEVRSEKESEDDKKTN
ncbi:unnamed protein product [Dovyalis caffra]|uniref:SMP-30/Gluconolactonase/LRE-like region domain-containing protein n=1 Tax=Dovyalis caffra TaxID=77055 RepID=A0AAV1SUV4_9ROSI|nr:unnamed protein product [Dovyalis caffra]